MIMSAAGLGTPHTKAEIKCQIDVMESNNWSLYAAFGWGFIAPGHSPTARISIFDRMEVVIASQLRSVDGDYRDNANRFTLMWREGEAEEISVFNQPNPCVCIRNDSGKSCEKLKFFLFWWDFLLIVNEILLFLSIEFCWNWFVLRVFVKI